MKLTAAIFCSLLLGTAAQAGTLADYAGQWPLQPDAAAGAYRLLLTPDVYAALKSEDLGDLEVFNSAGVAVPFGPIAPGPDRFAPTFGADASSDWHYTTARWTAGGAGQEFVYSIAGPLPIERIRVDLGSDNALAELTVLARHPGQGWRLVAGVSVFSLDVENTTLERNSVAFAATRERDWLLRSAQPLPRAPVLELGFRPDQFLLLAQGPPPFTLAAGSTTARRSNYPTAQLLETLRAELGPDWQPATVRLGPRAVATHRVVPGSTAAPAKAPASPTRKVWVLWIVLLLGAAVVAGMVFKLLSEKPPSL